MIHVQWETKTAKHRKICFRCFCISGLRSPRVSKAGFKECWTAHLVPNRNKWTRRISTMHIKNVVKTSDTYWKQHYYENTTVSSYSLDMCRTVRRELTTKTLNMSKNIHLTFLGINERYRPFGWRQCIRAYRTDRNPLVQTEYASPDWFKPMKSHFTRFWSWCAVKSRLLQISSWHVTVERENLRPNKNVKNGHV